MMTTWWLKNKEMSVDEDHLVSSLPQSRQKPDANVSNKGVSNTNSTRKASFRSSKNPDSKNGARAPTDTVISIDGGTKSNQSKQTSPIGDTMLSSNSKVQLNGSLTKVND